MFYNPASLNDSENKIFLVPLLFLRFTSTRTFNYPLESSLNLKTDLGILLQSPKTLIQNGKKVHRENYPVHTRRTRSSRFSTQIRDGQGWAHSRKRKRETSKAKRPNKPEWCEDTFLVAAYSIFPVQTRIPTSANTSLKELISPSPRGNDERWTPGATRFFSEAPHFALVTFKGTAAAALYHAATSFFHVIKEHVGCERWEKERWRSKSAKIYAPGKLLSYEQKKKETVTKIGLKKYKKICRLPLDLALLYALEGEKNSPGSGVQPFRLLVVFRSLFYRSPGSAGSCALDMDAPWELCYRCPVRLMWGKIREPQIDIKKHEEKRTSSSQNIHSPPLTSPSFHLAWAMESQAL